MKTQAEVQSARRERKHLARRHRRSQATIVVQGWLRDGVSLWSAGDDVHVYSPMAMLEQHLENPEPRRSRRTTHSGTQTTLDLVNPEAAARQVQTSTLAERRINMHRATPLNSSIRAYSAGGARSVRRSGRRQQADAGDGRQLHGQRDAARRSRRRRTMASPAWCSMPRRDRTARSGQRRDLHRLHGRQPIVPGHRQRWMIAGTACTSWRRATPRCFAGAATSSNST